MTTPVADDDVVTRRIQELRYERLRGGQPCQRETGGSSTNCWCMGRGLNGADLPCPEKGEVFPESTKVIPL